MKICTTCGTRYPDDVQMCSNDGTPLFASMGTDTSDAEAPTPEQPQAQPEVQPPSPTSRPLPSSEQLARGEADAVDMASQEEDQARAEALAAAEAEIQNLSKTPVPKASPEEMELPSMDAEALPSLDAEALPSLQADGEESALNSADFPSVDPIEPPMAAPMATATPVPDSEEEDGETSLLDMIGETIGEEGHMAPPAAGGQDPISLGGVREPEPRAATSAVMHSSSAAPAKKGLPVAALAIGAVVLLALLGAVGYFLILPMLSGS